MAAAEAPNQSFGLEIPLWKKAARKALEVNAVRQSYEYLLLLKRLQKESHPVLKNLNEMHGIKTMKLMEGFVDEDQARWLEGALQQDFPKVQHVAQTGFNGGHSAAIILGARPGMTLTSFDLGEHAYVRQANEFIEATFPDQHTLVLGDSQETLPQHVPPVPFDLVFIDGGHSKEIAAADIQNFAALSAKGAIVVLDDYLPDQHFGVGPYEAWNEAVESGLVTFLGKENTSHRAWVYGRFNN